LGGEACERKGVALARRRFFRKAGLPAQCTLPPAMMATWSAAVSASSMRCVVSWMVRPARSRRSSVQDWCFPSGSMADVNSSSTTRRESPMSVMPILTRHRYPPLSSCTSICAGSRCVLPSHLPAAPTAGPMAEPAAEPTSLTPS